METIIFYRPLGEKELELIGQSGYTRFLPRLPGQPIFYPLFNEEYATQMARDWNAKNSSSRSGYVRRFRVKAAFLSTHEVHTVGSSIHQEYWISAEELSRFNENMVGPIEVIAGYHWQ